MSTDRLPISRRTFLGTVAALMPAAFAGVLGYRKLRSHPRLSVSGSLLGANSKVGHLLRTGVSAKPSQTRKIQTAIVGGGISGLSAAWWLKKHRHHDFLLFEMEGQTGGNSQAGANAISKYPWGAHYVPLPGPDAHYVRRFFEEAGIITGYERGLPVYNEFYLCADPHERLFFQGEWQDGLIPQHGVQSADKEQYRRFFAYIEELKTKKGKDRRPVFNIPLDESSRDPEFLKLDQISMASFMEANGWTSKYLHWYISYCCRDDYGVDHSRVSAWAGLHYFASRAGVGANADSQTVLTWPEGNGWLASKLREFAQQQIQTNSLVYSIEHTESGCAVDVLNVSDGSAIRYLADQVIYCGPRFTASRVLKGYESKAGRNLDYPPWLVANISLKERPAGTGAPLSWDNVSYYSDSLGYIVADHQDLKLHRHETVITYYLPLDKKSVQEERKAAYSKTHDDWLALILPDLEKMHPGIYKNINHIDVWLWGHGMISPGISYLWSQEREEMRKPFGRVHFAHSDMSGVSIFEEAQYRGVEAAQAILESLKRHGAT